MKMYRQGDVLVVETKTVEAGAKEVEPDVKGRLILAEGEATGHAHAVAASTAALLIVRDLMFLHVHQQTQILHEEHAPIDLPPGNYRVLRQREYTPQEIRRVSD
jgi:hypothetical protein